MLKHQLLETSRGRIISLLQRGHLTADEIAAKLGLTPNAVRAQLGTMERDGVVRSSGKRAGATRPFRVFELTPDVEQVLSSAYLPLLAQLVEVFTRALPRTETEALMRKAGRGLAAELHGSKRLAGRLRARVEAASELLNTRLGAVTEVQGDGDGDLMIRGAGCPLSAITGRHASVCLAMESMLAELVDAPVTACCEHGARPKCCFRIPRGAAATR